MKTLTFTTAFGALLLTAVAVNAHQAPTGAQLTAAAIAAHQAETGTPHELTREEMAQRIQDMMAQAANGAADMEAHMADAREMARNMLETGMANPAGATGMANMGGTAGSGMGGGNTGGMGGGNAGGNGGMGGMGGGNAGGNGGMGGGNMGGN